jgi:hypothetical protein
MYYGGNGKEKSDFYNGKQSKHQTASKSFS